MRNITKFIAIISIAIFFANTAQAQVKFGVKAGLNLANASLAGEDNPIDTKMKIGYQIGGVVDYPINEKVSLQSSLILSSKGYNIDESESDGVYSYSFKSTISLTYTIYTTK